MELDKALQGMFDSQNKLRSKEGINNPSFISTQMQRLSQWIGIVEEHLADYEKDYEVNQAIMLKKYMLDEQLAVTAAEKRVKIELGEVKGQVVYLTRLTGSAWKQVGVAQSRVRHLVQESTTQL